MSDKKEVIRTMSIERAFKSAFDNSNKDVFDFAHFMRFDKIRAVRIQKSENITTDTLEKIAAFFEMPVSEFCKLGE